VKRADLVQPSRHGSDVSGERARARGSLIDRHALLHGIDHQASPRNGARDIVRSVGFPLGTGSRGDATAEATAVVFVVDDDVSVRESLELLIRSEGWRPETFGSAREFLSHPPVMAPGCLVLDVHLPDLNGLDLQERVAVERIELPVILITGHGDVPMAVRAMKAGAVEVLTKPLEADVLLGAIRKAIDRSRAALRDEGEMRALRESYAFLSPREREVMAFVVSGLLNKQVGAELGISEITVKAHRGKVMRKMKAASLVDLVKMAAKLGVAPRRP
jgi:FixJ family two-component response regulator